MGVRLIRVVMTDRHPREFRFAEVGAHPAHDIAHVVLKVGDPVAMLRRDDEAEMVPMLGPALDAFRTVHRLLVPVEEGCRLPFLPGALTTEIADMGGQRPGARHALAHVSRHQRLDDDPLAHVHAKGAARSLRSRLQRARLGAIAEPHRRREPLQHRRPDGAVPLQARRKADLEILPLRAGQVRHAVFRHCVRS
ncbi:hypothetical protein D3C87_1449990 [compost metagenome]